MSNYTSAYFRTRQSFTSTHYSVYFILHSQVQQSGHVATNHLQLLCSNHLSLLEHHGYQTTAGLHSLLGAGITAHITNDVNSWKQNGAYCHNSSVGLPFRDIFSPRFFTSLLATCHLLAQRVGGWDQESTSCKYV